MRYKGIYLVTELECLKKGSGAFRHIEVGMEYLNKYFDVQMFVFPNTGTQDSTSNNNLKERATKNSFSIKKLLFRTRIGGTLLDIKTLIANHIRIVSFFLAIKKRKPDFIYERAAYLNFNGLIISRILGIPHFLEANGLHYLRRNKYYSSFLNGLVKWLEQKFHSSSNYVFYVGLWGNIFGPKKENWCNIENGIEESLLYDFELHTKKVEKKINLCFIGHPMEHHNLPLLVQALKNSKNKDSLHLHLFGFGFESLVAELKEDISVTNYSFLDRKELMRMLKTMHVGILPGSNEYASNMKLFDYGVAKCIVIAPSLVNIRYWFSQSEIIFFERNNLYDFIEKIERLNKCFIENSKYGENLFIKIKENFLWETIFSKISKIITGICYEKLHSKV